MSLPPSDIMAALRLQRLYFPFFLDVDSDGIAEGQLQQLGIFQQMPQQTIHTAEDYHMQGLQLTDNGLIENENEIVTHV